MDQHFVFTCQPKVPVDIFCNELGISVQFPLLVIKLVLDNISAGKYRKLVCVGRAKLAARFDLDVDIVGEIVNVVINRDGVYFFVADVVSLVMI